jgi:phage terminase large subunit-like protein
MQTAKTKTPPTPSLPDRTRAYAEAVVSGEIIAGPHVRNACRRHLKDLEDGHDRGLWFDHEEADRVFGFFEGVLRLSEGQFDGLPFQLHQSQAFVVGSLFGWKRANGTRRFRRAYIEQGKGNGKSPMAGGIGLYGMTADGEAGAQVYAAAAKRDQAGILFADAVKMVKQSPALEKRIDFSGGPGREYNMAHHASGSFFRPVSRDTGKSGSGPRPYFVLADEVHELPDGKILEMLERGFKFRRQPLLFMITNSGSDRNSVAWHEHEWAVKVAAGHEDAVTDPTFVGRVLDDELFSYVCALDEGDDPLNDPSCWAKANPLLGVTITEEYLAGVVAQAKNIPTKQNNILRLHFCVWTDSDVAWMSREVVEPLLHDFDPADHKGKDLFCGLDLSQNRDITAQGCVVVTGEKEVEATDKDGAVRKIKKPTYDVWIEAWTPGDTMQERFERDKLPYPVWAKQGFIHAPSGENISYLHVAQTLVEYDRDYSVQMVAYDRYAFKRFEEDAAELGLDLPFVEHPQGGTKKGKPTDEMVKAAERDGKQAEGLWFPASLRLLEDAMLEGRVRFRRNPVLVSAIMSAVVEKDKWDNAWLSKQKSVNKIDAIVAVVMAFGAAASGGGRGHGPEYQLIVL